jgi:hypothetical protein
MEKTIKLIYDEFVARLKEGLEINRQPLVDLRMPAPKRDSEVIIVREPAEFDPYDPPPTTIRDRRNGEQYFRYEPFYIKIMVDDKVLMGEAATLIEYYVSNSVRDVLNGLSDRSKVFYVGDLVELSYKPLVVQYTEIELKVNVISPRS